VEIALLVIIWASASSDEKSAWKEMLR